MLEASTPNHVLSVAVLAQHFGLKRLGQPVIRFNQLVTGDMTYGDVRDVGIGTNIVFEDVALEEDGPKRTNKLKCMDKYVLRDSSIVRGKWDIVTYAVFVYVGTILPYQVTFLENGLPVERPLPDGFQLVLRVAVATFFWIDVVINFIFSYRDALGEEVVSLSLIVQHYLGTHFIVNLIACISSSFGNTRLPQLIWLLRYWTLRRSSSALLGSVAASRAFRIINILLALFWSIHIIACGWYLCASFHEEANYTWVALRSLPDGSSLIDKGPGVQWAHSVYLVFMGMFQGDMYAATVGEIIYACFTMLVGAIINAFLLSEVINLVTAVDQRALVIQGKTGVVESFARHTGLGVQCEQRLKNWVRAAAGSLVEAQYDRNEMQELMSRMPRSLLAALPEQLFDGLLASNGWMRAARRFQAAVPPEFTISIALKSVLAPFSRKEVVYQTEDTPAAMFIISSGTFAFVAEATPGGGVHNSAVVGREIQRQRTNDILFSESHGGDTDDQRMTLYPYMLMGRGSYFGDFEILCISRRQAIARCESEGHALTIPKDAVSSVLDMFPESKTCFPAVARSREATRKRRQLQLTYGRSFHNLAAVTIQQGWRRRLWRRGGGGGAPPNCPRAVSPGGP